MSNNQSSRPKLRVVDPDENQHQADSDQVRDDALAMAHRKFQQRAERSLPDDPPPAA